MISLRVFRGLNPLKGKELLNSNMRFFTSKTYSEKKKKTYVRSQRKENSSKIPPQWNYQN